MKLDEFKTQIQFLYEPEFGDFKRKVSLYLQRLEEGEPDLAKGAGRQTLEKIKNTVLFDPDGDIESTRSKILELLQELPSEAKH
ncbi:MAG: hypothetical protein AB7F86_05945 [Bdellovibrionales bacterium]